MQIENKLAVLILCGGKGTRLGTKFKNTNKSLITIENKTLISTNIDYLFKQKFYDIFVVTGHAHKKVEKESSQKEGSDTEEENLDEMSMSSFST